MYLFIPLASPLYMFFLWKYNTADVIRNTTDIINVLSSTILEIMGMTLSRFWSLGMCLALMISLFLRHIQSMRVRK